MMSRRCEYALRALVDLGLAKAAGRAVLPVQEIAARERIPEGFLEQILLGLRRAGVLRSRRGRSGGYALAKPPGRIRMGAVVRLLDGPLAPISCVSRTAYAPCSCPDEDLCGVRRVMEEARNALAAALDGWTLADAVDRTRRAYRKAGRPVPFARLPRGSGREV
jgi:Rrf2 family protein